MSVWVFYGLLSFIIYTKTRSYYRKESAAVTHKLENSQPIINIEIDNNTLYVLFHFKMFRSQHCYYNTTLYYSKWCIYIYCTILYSKKYLILGFQVCVCTSMEFLLPNEMLIAVIH